MSTSGIYFVLLIAGAVAFFGGLFLYAWVRRNRRLPRPKQPYREWPDD